MNHYGRLTEEVSLPEFFPGELFVRRLGNRVD